MNDCRNHDIRNLAIIAHVDHGKTTLVDALLKQGQVFLAHQQVGELIMDANLLERERGIAIAILARSASVSHRGGKINIIIPLRTHQSCSSDRLLATVVQWQIKCWSYPVERPGAIQVLSPAR